MRSVEPSTLSPNSRPVHFSLSGARGPRAGEGGPVTGCQRADLVGPALAYAQEIAQDELNHVRFLRVNLGNESIACPPMDIGAAFATLGAAALGDSAPDGFVPFSPYFDVFSFYAGAFVFEDVGVTAYLGAAPLIQNKGVLSAAARIHSAEGYHSGIIRALLANVRAAARRPAQPCARRAAFQYPSMGKFAV